MSGMLFGRRGIGRINRYMEASDTLSGTEAASEACSKLVSSSTSLLNPRRQSVGPSSSDESVNGLSVETWSRSQTESVPI